MEVRDCRVVGKCLSIALCLAALACDASGPRYVASRGMFGDKWPFATIEKGSLRCVTEGSRQLAVLDTSEGIRYGLNEPARESGLRDGVKELKQGAGPADLQPLIDLALAVCARP